MLSPHDRTTLLEAFRPPPGYQLDVAVGTSFTLDLEALLSAPIAFALFDVSDTDDTDGGAEPVGLLEAIRRYAELITVFCEAGQIAVPPKHRTVFAWLEDSVVGVSPPRQHRIFHPKLWAIRYRKPESDERIVRVLCATRNLTFDRSWDTLLTLDSEPFFEAPDELIERQQPLSDFVRRLPDLSVNEPRKERLEAIDTIARDLARVPLIAPEPFHDMRFHILGLGDEPDLFDFASERALVLAPFLTDSFLERIQASHDLAALISREESLDRIDPQFLETIERVAVLNAAASTDDSEAIPEDDSSEGHGEAPDPGIALHGLHAKFFAFDERKGSRVFTGSANATGAAFDGNVEVLVELRGPKEAGVESLLEETPDEVGFDDLLVDYITPDETEAADEQEKLELSLDAFRRSFATIPLTASVASSGDDYALTLKSRRQIPSIDADAVEISVWPTTLSEDQALATLAPRERVDATFEVTLEGLTSFFIVRAEARRERLRARTSFLVNAPLKGASSERHARLLAAMLRDRDRLLRYLLLLLHDDAGAFESELGGGGWFGNWTGGGWDDLPLFELLVRAVDRHPERLDHIERLLYDLDDQRAEILPEKFDSIWDPVWSYRQQAKR